MVFLAASLSFVNMVIIRTKVFRNATAAKIDRRSVVLHPVLNTIIGLTSTVSGKYWRIKET